MKIALLSFVFVLSAGLIAWCYQDDSSRPCLEDWVTQTQGLFSDASAFVKNLSSPKKNTVINDDLDEKLQALLPSENIDLSYRPEQQKITQNLQLAVESDSSELLPNLFSPQLDSGTSVSGKVHMDEDDNIIGAEVQVEIPTNL